MSLEEIQEKADKVIDRIAGNMDNQDVYFYMDAQKELSTYIFKLGSIKNSAYRAYKTKEAERKVAIATTATELLMEKKEDGKSKYSATAAQQKAEGDNASARLDESVADAAAFSAKTAYDSISSVIIMLQQQVKVLLGERYVSDGGA